MNFWAGSYSCLIGSNVLSGPLLNVVVSVMNVVLNFRGNRMSMGNSGYISREK